ADRGPAADAEVVGLLGRAGPPHLLAQRLVIGAVETLERAAVDRDLVRQRAGVEAASPCQRDALVEPQQRLTVRRLLLDDDLHVRHLAPQIRRQRVERILGVLGEQLVGVALAHRPSLVRRRTPSRRWTARSSSPSLTAPQTKTAKTTASGMAKKRTITRISATSSTQPRVVSRRYPLSSSGGSRRWIGVALTREVVVSP